MCGAETMRRPRNEEALVRRRGQSQFTVGDKGTWDCSPADHFVQPFLFRDEAHERLAQDCTGIDMNSSWSNSFDNFLLTNSTLFGNPPTTDQGNYFPLLTILLPQDISEKNIKERQQGRTLWYNPNEKLVANSTIHLIIWKSYLFMVGILF